MHIVAIALVLAGAAAFLMSVQLAGRANPEGRLPYLGRPAVLPGWSIGLRVVGATMVVSAAMLLAPKVGYWSVAIVAVALLPGLVMIPLHNRAVAVR